MTFDQLKVGDKFIELNGEEQESYNVYQKIVSGYNSTINGRANAINLFTGDLTCFFDFNTVSQLKGF